MDTCCSGHEEIVYNSRYCPMCELIDEKNALKERIEGLEKQVNDLEERVVDLEEELAEEDG